MRSFGKSAIAVLCAALLAGCSSRGMTIEQLLADLSYETTASVSAHAPKHSAPASPAQSASSQSQTGLPPTALAIAPVEGQVQTAALMVPSPRRAAPRKREKQRVYSQRFRDAKPINFGKHAPHRLPVHGVDVSRWTRPTGSSATFHASPARCPRCSTSNGTTCPSARSVPRASR